MTGRQHRHYTVRPDDCAVLEVPDGDCGNGQGGVEAPYAVQRSPTSSCYPQLPQQSSVWVPVCYPQLHAPGPQQAAASAGGWGEMQRGFVDAEGSQEGLEEEPSAPPMSSEAWAAEEDGAGAAVLPLPSASPATRAVRFAEPAAPGGFSGKPCGGASPAASGGSGACCSPAVQHADPGPWSDYGASWGVASTLCAAPIGSLRWTSETAASACGEEGASPPSREVSEETVRYQALLATLAARRREPAVAAAPAAPTWQSAPARQASTEAEEAGWQSPLLQVQPAWAGGEQAQCLPRAAASGPPSPARWAGVQTLLNNLGKSASSGATRAPAPGLSFWEQPVTDEDEVPAPALAPPPVSSSPRQLVQSAPPLLHAHRHTSAESSSAEPAAPPPGLARQFAPLGQAARHWPASPAAQ